MKLTKNRMFDLLRRGFHRFRSQSARRSGRAPIRPRTNRGTHTAASNGPALYPNEFRSIDGSGNNPIDGTRGAANIPLLRNTTIAYADGVGSPAAPDEPSAREISNDVFAQDHEVPCATNVSDYLWQWGQFIDHDMDLTPTTNPAERFDIQVPLGDPFFDPDSTGTQIIELDRSIYQMVNGIRQQVNADTAFIDASQVYGSDEARAQELRTLDGTGKLKSSDGDLLPYNVDGFPNAPDTSAGYFLAGDVRSNEQVGLTAMQTLFMREHNYWATRIKKTASVTLMTTASTTARAPSSARKSSTSPIAISSRLFSARTRSRATADTIPTSIRVSRIPSPLPPSASVTPCSRLPCADSMQIIKPSGTSISRQCFL